MELGDPAALVLILGNLLAATFAAAIGIGAGPLMLVLMGSIVPLHALVPLHSVLMFGTTASRCWLFREHVQWRIAAPFILGTPLGALLGAKLYVSVPEKFIAIAIGTLMLVAVWLPRINWRPRVPHPFFLVGAIQSFVSAIIGFGAVLQTVIVHSRLSKLEVTGTLAASFTVMNLFKLLGFAVVGFAFAPYAGVLLIALAGGVLGSWLGRLLAHRLSERHFRTAFRVVLTLGALRILHRALLA